MPLRPSIALRAAKSITSAQRISSQRCAFSTTQRTKAVEPQITKEEFEKFLEQEQEHAAQEHAHEDHYDPPSGWLFGVKPGEKAEKEGWEGIWVWGFFGGLGLATVAYAFKPDTS